ncbi:MAG: methionine synthase [Thermoplasmatota archaeon]
MDLNQNLITTVVGSYPARPSDGSLARSYFEDVDPYMESIEMAVKAQMDAGIELVSDGQTRGGMVEIFAEKLKGFRMKRRPEIISKIEYRGPITVEDQNKVRNSLPENIGLKGIITGPWTLVKSSYDIYYEDTRKAVTDTAEALKSETKKLSKICDVIQIDEPFLSIEYEPYIKDVLETMLPNNVTTALHVCGDVVDIAEKLVEIDVDILDHEFAANPHLYDTYEELSFDQRLAPGVVTTESKIESVDKIKERIEKAVNSFGTNILIDPDCGLRNVKKEVADKKLKNMVEARDVVLDERS